MPATNYGPPNRAVGFRRPASSPIRAPASGSQELLTRIRVPLELWDYILYRKLGDRGSRIESNGVATFLARAQKDILSEVRLVFAGPFIFRDRDIEAALTGKRCPGNREHPSLWIDGKIV